MSAAPPEGAQDPIAEETAKVVATLETQVQTHYAPPRVKRDAHPKMHGCVQAEVVVDPAIRADLRHGVFAVPGSRYRAWVRFSNAFGVDHDLKFDTRGMGIKLLGVSGDKPWSDEPSTQDFLLATHDAFFMPDEKDYNEFARAAGADPPNVVKFFLERRRLWHAFAQLLRSGFVLARNPLSIRFFSQTPYRLGPHVVKVQARPCITQALGDQLPAAWWFRCQAIVANAILMTHQSQTKKPAAEAWCERHIADRNLLRLAMMAFLAEHDASFDLLVQPRIDVPEMPIHDATIRWPESLSAFEKVATITIPRQMFWPQPGLSEALAAATNEMMDLGENMSFNPWHALPEHEPLGAINLMRRRVYPAIVSLRNGLNRVGRTVPTVADYDRLKQIVQ
jgi:hypothetical protein